MKKYIALLLSLIICISFSACGKATDTEPNVSAVLENAGTTESTEGYSENESVSFTENSSETNSTESTKAHNSTEKKNTEVKNSTLKAEIGTEATVISTEATEFDTEQTVIGTEPTEIGTEKSTQPQPKTVCTVEIECKKILSKKNKFKKDISLVPSDGVILSPVSVDFDDGATAYDALQKACTQNGIALNAENSSFGVYVVGVGGVEEKDCGSQSGWVYTVNGKSPSVSISKYKIKNGDSIVLSYVCQKKPLFLNKNKRSNKK